MSERRKTGHLIIKSWKAEGKILEFYVEKIII